MNRLSVWGRGEKITVREGKGGEPVDKPLRPLFCPLVIAVQNLSARSFKIYHLDKLECFDFLRLLFLVSIICPLMQEHFL